MLYTDLTIVSYYTIQSFYVISRDDSASLSLEHVLKHHFEAIPGFRPNEDADYEEFNNIHI